MARILLTHLDSALAAQLGQVLARQQHEIQTADALDVQGDGPDVVFSGCDNGCYKEILGAVRRWRPKLPFVVVSSYPDTSEWIDALEAGATDYCAAPFENRQIRWILDSALRYAA
jgi:DNA-binding NtrC family response regulator